jgi:phosphoribulokinase
MARDLTQAIESAYSERVNLFVLALTGRTGSGCTTTASALSKQINELAVSKEGLTSIEGRKFDICHDFSRAQWVPFKIITVSTLIFSFLLEENFNDVEVFLKRTLKGSASASASIIQTIKDEVNNLKGRSTYVAAPQLQD